MAGRPRKVQNELEKAEEQFQKFDQGVKEMTMDRMNAAPKLEEEPQTKLSSREIERSKEIWLKPKRTQEAVDPKTGIPQKFNEKFRKEYEFKKEYVQFIAENKELIGESIVLWTRPYGGMPAEEWEVPTNKPVFGPRYLAEQIRRKFYHRIKLEERSTPSNFSGSDGLGSYYGNIAVDHTIQRLDAYPVHGGKSVFMGASNF